MKQYLENEEEQGKGKAQLQEDSVLLADDRGKHNHSIALFAPVSSTTEKHFPTRKVRTNLSNLI